MAWYIKLNVLMLTIQRVMMLMLIIQTMLIMIIQRVLMLMLMIIIQRFEQDC